MLKFRGILCSLLIFTLFISFTQTAEAANDDGFLDLSLSGFACGEPVIDEETTAKVDEFKKNDANMAEKFLVSQVQNVWQMGPINTMNSLIFGNPYCVWAGESAAMSPDGVFTESEKTNIIDPMLKMFSGLFVILLTLAMLFSGLKLGFAGIRGKGFADFGEDMKMWIVTAFFVMCYSMFINLVFQFNAAITLTVKDLITSAGVSLDQASMMATADSITNVMAFIFVALAEWILALILNFVYIARKVIILLLIVLGYVAAYSLLFAKTRAFFGVWLKELLGNVFLQSIHAIVFYGMIMFAANGSGVIFKMGLMLMFIPISGMISKWLNIGDSSSKLGSSLTMMGLGGMVSTMMLASQAGNIVRGGSMMGGNTNLGDNVMSNMANSANSAGGLSSLANNIANDSAVTGISMDAKGTNSQAWNSTKSAITNAGGMFGALGGMVAGPAGMIAGQKAGSAIAGGIVQGGRNMAFGLANMAGQVGQAKGYTGPGGTGFKAMMGDAVARRQFFGNMGEALGGSLGLNGVGRNVGLAMSGVSRQMAAQTVAQRFGMLDQEGNLMPATFQNLSAQYPNAEMKFMQTNAGSGFYVNNNGDWQQVGVAGAADASLKAGEMRVIDYKLADASVPYQMQANGTYTAPFSTANIGDVRSPAIPVDSQTGQSIPGVVPNIPNSGTNGQAFSTVAPNQSLNSQFVNPSATQLINTPIDQQIASMQGGSTATIVGGAPQALTGGNPAIPMPSSQGGATPNPQLVGGGNTGAPQVLSGGNPSIPIQPAPGGAIPNPQLVGGGNTATGGAPQVLSGGNPSIPIQSAPGGAMPSPQFVEGGNTATGSAPQVLSGGNPSIPIQSASGGAMPSSTPSPQLVGGGNTSAGGAPQVLSGSNPSPQSIGGTVVPTPSPAPSPQQSLSAATNSGGPVRQQVVGLQGSTASVMRTSNAYIVSGATQNGQITKQTFQAVSQPTMPRYENPEFKAGNVNPDAFVYQNAAGVDHRTGSDKVADSIQKVGQVRKSWSSNLQKQKTQTRSKKIV